MNRDRLRHLRWDAALTLHALTERLLQRIAGLEPPTDCPSCGSDRCHVHCPRCFADCTVEDHRPTCVFAGGVNIVGRESWPHGMLCPSCSEPLRLGDRYIAVDIGDGWSMSVCVGCAAIRELAL